MVADIVPALVCGCAGIVTGFLLGVRVTLGVLLLRSRKQDEEGEG